MLRSMRAVSSSALIVDHSTRQPLGPLLIREHLGRLRRAQPPRYRRSVPVTTISTRGLPLRRAGKRRRTTPSAVACTDLKLYFATPSYKQNHCSARNNALDLSHVLDTLGISCLAVVVGARIG